MKRKNLIKISCVSLFILFIALTPLSTVNASIQGNLEIIKAGYDDLDNDGYLDDIYTSFNIKLSKDKGKSDITISTNNKDKPSYSSYYLVYQLIYPSGDQYATKFEFLLPNAEISNDFMIHLYNGAIESGWYTVQLYLYYAQTGELISYDKIVFDPPQTSGFPSMCVMFML